MKIKKVVITIIGFLTIITNRNQKSDLEKYVELKVNNVPSIKQEDLPSEFSDESFKVIDEFIRKTIYLNFEILIYFDYITGEILKCKFGDKTNVKLKIKEDEFNNKHVDSIHNHTKDMYTPPSDKNFGIFSRDWEDYELIAGKNGLWILKGKLKNDLLTFELKLNSSKLFNMTLDYYSKRYQNEDERNDKIDEEYGKLLKNYINNKNQSKIQLIKREYSNDCKNG